MKLSSAMSLAFVLTLALVGPALAQPDGDDPITQAVQLLANSQPDDAIVALARSDTSASDPLALYLLGAAYEQRGDSSAAIRSYLSALSQEPEFSAPLHALAGLYAKLPPDPEGQDPLDLLIGLVRAYPDDPDLWTTLGAKQARSGLIDDAFGSALRAVNLDSANGPGHLLLGALFELSAQPGDALAEYQLILEISSDQGALDIATQKIQELSGG